MDRNDFGVSELLNPRRVDWVDETDYLLATPANTARLNAAIRQVRRPCNLEFTDGEGDHILCCVEAGDDIA